MADLSGIVKQLKDERNRVEKQLSALNAALTAFVGAYSGSAKPRVSAAARREDEPGTEGTLGEADGSERSDEHGEVQAHSVSSGSPEDGSGSAGTVGESKSGEEGGLILP